MSLMNLGGTLLMLFKAKDVIITLQNHFLNMVTACLKAKKDFLLIEKIMMQLVGEANLPTFYNYIK